MSVARSSGSAVGYKALCSGVQGFVQWGTRLCADAAVALQLEAESLQPKGRGLLDVRHKLGCRVDIDMS